MYVVVPCKYGKDPIENSEDNARTTFSPYKVYRDFFKRSRADNSAARGRIWLIYELNRDLMYVVVPYKYGKDPIEIAEILRGQHFLHTKSMGVVCCHSNQGSNSICLKTLCRQCPTIMMLLIKFDCNRPTGL